METYVVKIRDDFFGELEGEFDSDSPEEAGEKAKEYYACELGTYMDCIEVISIRVGRLHDNDKTVSV